MRFNQFSDQSKHILLITFLIALGVLLFSIPVSAEFYKYKDENGVIRFTDDLSEVPKDQRPAVKDYKEENDFLSPEEIEKREKQEAEAARKAAEAEELSLIEQRELERKRKSENLDKEREKLDKEYSELLKQNEALNAEMEKLDTAEQKEAYNERVIEMNKKISDYDKKQKAFEEKQKAFEDENSQKIENTTVQ